MTLVDIDPLKERIDKEVKEGKVLDGWAFFFKVYLDDAPTIDVDKPKGKWIMHIDDLFPCESTQECSICHAEQLINGNDDNFCPNCGADMREREGK